MRVAVLVALKDLKLRLRDRSAWAFTIAAPLLLATIISFALGGGNEAFHAKWVIVDEDGGEISASFADAIRTGLGDAVTLETTSSRAEANRLLDDEDFGAAFLIPAGFTQAIQQGQPLEIKVLRTADAPIGGEIAESFAEGFASEVNAGRIAVQTAIEGGALLRPGAPTVEALIQEAVQGRIPASVRQGTVGGRAVNSASYFGPAMAIFFLSFTVNFGLVGVLAERREGTLKRILASPTRPGAFILGKSLGAFLLGIFSLTVMAIATTLMLGASWGPPVGVAILGSATIFAFMGVAAIGTTFARTEEGASGFVGIVMALFALLGGNFIRITDAPQLIQTLSLGTPNGWALRGFIDLSTGGGVAAVLGPVSALLFIGLATSAVALFRGRRLLTG
jgi:ABC-2 type transport system permease protein